MACTNVGQKIWQIACNVRQRRQNVRAKIEEEGRTFQSVINLMGRFKTMREAGTGGGGKADKKKAYRVV